MAAAPSVDKARANAVQLTLSAPERQQSISVLLQDLRSNDSSKTKDASAVLADLQALKLLGRTPQGSEELSTKASLETLCTFAQLKEVPAPASSSGKAPTSPSEARLEAWRILCNTLKLHPSAAITLETELDKCIENAAGCLSIGPASLEFVASRLLFLVTVKGSEVVRTLVDRMAIIAHIHEALQRYCDILDTDHPKQLTGEETMALAEILKLLYNITIFYPRLQTLDPKSASSEAGTPTSSSSGPDSPDSSKPSSALGRGIRSVLSRSSSSNKSRPTSPKNLTPRGLDYLTSLLARLVIVLPYTPSAPLSGSPLGGALLCLGELPAIPAWFSDRPAPPHASILESALPSTSTRPDTDVTGALPPLVAKLLDVLDRTTEHCFPSDIQPDDANNRARLEREGRDVVDLDAELAPVLLIIRKCVIGDDRGQVGAILRARLLSSKIDRSDRLDKRTDLTGRLLRLMGSVYFSNTKVGAGELLFALCGQDSELFTSTLGYGLAAGFLASNGILGAPVGAGQDDEAASSRPVNPVTGVYEPSEPPPDPTASMSEEDKEREAERLFVLFERLKKTGVVDIKNPVEEAQQGGRFEEIEENDQEQAKRQEEQEEREAEEEMRWWKGRNKARDS